MDSTALRSSWPLSPAADAVAGAGQASTPSQGDRAKVLDLAQQFEAFFVVQMIRQMRQSMLDDQSDAGLGAGTMTDTMDVEMARQMSQAGGIGLTAFLRDAIERQTLGSSSATTVGPAGDAAATPTVSDTLSPGPAVRTPAAPVAGPRVDSAAAVPLPIAAPISSPFGYRTDPFSGATRFHAGVDIAAAYGREVPSAGAGEVVFSGAQGGYGNTVVVEHQGGIRTRYAHLSSIQVEVGARVNAGTVVGRVGSTGHSTGPHLHFEVLQDGRPVNPAVAATRFAGLLKIEGVVADLPISQPSVHGVAVGVDDEDSGQ